MADINVDQIQQDVNEPVNVARVINSYNETVDNERTSTICVRRGDTTIIIVAKECITYTNEWLPWNRRRIYGPTRVKTWKHTPVGITPVNIIPRFLKEIDVEAISSLPGEAFNCLFNDRDDIVYEDGSKIKTINLDSETCDFTITDSNNQVYTMSNGRLTHYSGSVEENVDISSLYYFFLLTCSYLEIDMTTIDINYITNLFNH